MRYFLCLLCLCVIPKLGVASSIDSLLLHKIELEIQAQNYQKVCSLYVSANEQQNELYTKENSQKIEDLRLTYSIKELELENAIQNNKLLRYIWLACCMVVLLVVFGLLDIYIQNKRIRKSRLELMRAKRIAENSIRNKSVFLSNMSHEIRTPLNALSGFSEVLAMPDMDDETLEQCNELIQLNSDLLLKLVNDVVDISCLDINNMKFQIQSYDVIEICRNVVKTVSSIKKTEADIIFESPLDSLIAQTDKDRLQQLLINLLVNATKFTKEGSITLKVEKTKGNGKLFFSVTDTGCGIAPEKQEKLFQRFEKLNEEAVGFGLGLCICQLIVKRFGGKIWIDTEYTDGARFIFTHTI